MNLKIKVETQGTEGAKNTLTQDDSQDFMSKILTDIGYGKSSETVLLKAIEREVHFSTGIGAHLAIPHFREDVMKKPVISFAKVNDIE